MVHGQRVKVNIDYRQSFLTVGGQTDKQCEYRRYAHSNFLSSRTCMAAMGHEPSFYRRGPGEPLSAIGSHSAAR